MTYWQSIATDAEARLQVLREYAAHVFGSPEEAARWLHRGNRVIARHDTPLEAARTPEGFFEAMAELSRLSLFEQREAQKRAQLAGWATRKPDYERAA